VKVTVVGAGVVGCAVACELARRGARVLVLDPRPPGQGATRASAGMLAPYIEGHGHPLLALGVRSLALYDEFVKRLSADAGLDVEYGRGGTLQVAGTDAEAARLATLARELAQSGVAHRVLDAGELTKLEPAISSDMRGALLIPSHGYVVADALMRALTAAARRHQVEFETAAVTEVAGASGGAGVCIRTADRRIDSDVAVLAAGSWSPLVRIDTGARAATDEGAPAVRPFRGQIVRLAVQQPPVSHVLWGPGCYVVPWRDGTVLVGATVENVGFDEQPTAGGVRSLLNAATRWIPALETAAFAGVRVGLRPGTGDELPIIGRSSAAPSVVYATGHYRNGVLLAPLTAALVAALVMDGHEGPGMEMMRPARFGL
jgi:glycine oxidase